jgi:hypothetical protein
MMVAYYTMAKMGCQSKLLASAMNPVDAEAAADPGCSAPQT